MQENNKEILTINKRIITIVDFYNLTRYKFSQETGISDAVLCNIYKGKNKPSYDLIEKILNKYKTIDANWLLTGRGTMIKEEPQLQVLQESIVKYNKEDVSIQNPIQSNMKDSLFKYGKQTVINAGDDYSFSKELLQKIIDLSSENALLKNELLELKKKR